MTNPPEVVESVELLRRARGGDPLARRQLALRQHQQLLGILRVELRRAGGVRAEPEDVLHDVYLKIIRGFDELRGDTLEAFVRWTRSIARNTVREVRRRDARSAKLDACRDADVTGNSLTQAGGGLVAAIEGHLTSVSGRAVRLEALDALSAALALLPDHYRAIIKFRFLEGLSVEETAAATQRSRGSVLMISHRAMRRMAETIHEFPLLTKS